MMSDGVKHVSDTALLVAAARAAETDMEDGLVRDPYAAQLAGERGIALVRSGSPSRWRSFGIGLRSRFIDQFLSSELEDGTVDCVLSLGAGLDARPWRLPLPGSLHWVEVDFAQILDYKYAMLKDVTPQCRLERMTADLNDRGDRQRIFETVCASSKRVVLLTEGLLFYLPRETLRGLAMEASGCHRWILDVAPQTSMLLSLGGDAMRQAVRLSHETRLEGPAVLETILNSGWTTAASKTFMKDGAPFAVQRIAINCWVPDPNTERPSPDDPAGVWVFQRSA